MATIAAREARRRKILDRGADRLALISGRIETFPSESTDKPSNDHDSSQPLISDGPPPQPSDPTTAVSANDEDGGVGAKLPTPDHATDDADHGGSSVEPPPFQERGIGIESALASASDVSSNAQSSVVSSVDQISPLSTSGSEPVSGQRKQRTGFLTPNQISSAISATERLRLLSSVAVASLVVLSYIGFPLLGSNPVKSCLSFRPLYLLLLTNVTLVLVKLLFNHQIGSEGVGRAEYQDASTGRYDWAAQAGMALEVGLVVKKATDAVFMDCSIYALILICILSLA